MKSKRNLVKSKSVVKPKVAKELQENNPEGVKSLDLDNADGVLATINKQPNREIHIRYASYNNGADKLVDIRYFVNSTKFTGYTAKGIAIPEKDLQDFREYVNLIADAVLAGELEANNLEITK